MAFNCKLTFNGPSTIGYLLLPLIWHQCIVPCPPSLCLSALPEYFCLSTWPCPWLAKALYLSALPEERCYSALLQHFDWVISLSALPEWFCLIGPASPWLQCFIWAPCLREVPQCFTTALSMSAFVWVLGPASAWLQSFTTTHCVVLPIHRLPPPSTLSSAKDTGTEDTISQFGRRNQMSSSNI